MRRSPRGFLCADLAFTLPILGFLLFGLFEFSTLFFARGLRNEVSNFLDEGGVARIHQKADAIQIISPTVARARITPAS